MSYEKTNKSTAGEGHTCNSARAVQRGDLAGNSGTHEAMRGQRMDKETKRQGYVLRDRGHAVVVGGDQK